MCFGGLLPKPLKISIKKPSLPFAPRLLAALRAAPQRHLEYQILRSCCAGVIGRRRATRQGLLDVANQPGQPIRSVLVALVGQTLQLLEVAMLCRQLSQPLRSVLVTFVYQASQLLKIAMLCRQLSQPIRSVLVPAVHQPPQLLKIATLCRQLSQPIRSVLVAIVGQPTQH